MASTLAYPAVVTAIRALLVADSTLTSLLATAPTVYGGGPAIFSDGAVPEQQTFPVLVIGGGSETSANTMGTGDSALKWGSRVSLMLRGMSTQRNDDELASIMARVKAVLYEGRALTVSGYASASVVDISGVPIYVEQIAGVLVRHYPVLTYVEVHQ